ncbi:iron chelate uptake ABC transporter family permease subunit [Streptomyces sp. 3MP-14]|uniref:Iron chelate uptake ABC transporter family permease subunit n=1 Tax=Streptomyces mimosae TaxID=2586635 RepID=A0A5N5ZYT4_9ACTN|nr:MULTISPECIES: iron ABC transporter permease [Streptomyces]KAB8160278.1 iron chelate uptake ABC transporter family permease subunit [Streptomyces mimosae]KAB8172960.1 iron chelate uptake ABC transporter family permease subunit [Streptomyces sp. 3MP-14]
MVSPPARLPVAAGPAPEPAEPAPEPPAGRGSVLPVAGLAVLLAASALLAIGWGSAVISPTDTARYLWAAVSGGTIAADEVTRYQIVWQVRTPRVLLAVVVGAGLSAIGVAVQALVRNALADPFVLGISSGASVGAVAVLTVGLFGSLGIYALSVGAFAGALAASALVYLASYSRAGLTPLRLVLTGIALAYGFQALMSVLVYLAPDGEATHTVLFWTMGGLGAATWGTLPAVAATVLLGVAVLHRASRSLDVLALGDETAASLGVDTTALRRRLFALTSLMTGAIVAVSGAIGFVGLIVPHLTRIVVGARHVRVLLVAPLLGAVFMVWADLLARTLAAPRELPLGVITALVGVPVFITLMRRRGYLFGGR